MVFKHIGVIGGGQMGAGIAASIAAYGFNVTVVDPIPNALERSQQMIVSNLKRLLSENSQPGKVDYASTLSVLEACDLVIEAVPERLELKHQLYQELNSIVCKDTIIGTNTSSLPISTLASVVDHPGRFIGIHFMNPVIKMPLVELIPSSHTSDHVRQKVESFISVINKISVISGDVPGFIVNRLLIPMLNTAFKLLETNVATADDIDNAMIHGASFPMGPLKLADFIGLDTCLFIMETLNTEWPNAGYQPSELLKTYVQQGHLGRKTKQGVYTY